LDERIEEEVQLTQDMLHLQGALSLILTASITDEPDLSGVSSDDVPPKLQPSAAALN